MMLARLARRRLTRRGRRFDRVPGGVGYARPNGRNDGTLCLGWSEHKGPAGLTFVLTQ
jgi:hypothetical protein